MSGRSAPEEPVEPAPADVPRETLQLKQMDPRGEVHGRLVHTRHEADAVAKVNAGEGFPGLDHPNADVCK